MANATRASSSQVQTFIPSTITYRENKEQNDQQVSPYWQIISSPIQKLGLVLRDAFYLPWYSNHPSIALRMDQDLAKKTCDALTCRATSSGELSLVKNHFTFRDVLVRIEGKPSRIFTVRLFESEKTIQNKKLQLILFSFNGNQEERAINEPRQWEPLTLNELSESPRLVLKAFQNQGIQVDSLVATSLGNVMLDSLKNVSSKERENVPSTLVLNRGLTSVKKVADRLYSFPLNYLLYGAAKLTGWNADPEQELLKFIQKGRGSQEEKPRKVVIIEAREDFYFSKAGGLADDYHKKLENVGATVFRAAFWPFPFHTRAHHAISLEHLINNKAMTVISNTAEVSFESGESAATLLARNVFLAGDNDVHTCFYVCGNDATLDIATMREMVPLLSAFMKEAKSMEASNSAAAMTG